MPPWLNELTEDHARLRALASRLQPRRAETDQPPSAILLELLLFLDQHSGREEATLFQALSPILPAGRGPLAVARAEHVALGAVGSRLRLAIGIPSGHPDYPVASRTVRHDLPLLLKLLERHLWAEEASLFPLAERLPAGS
ncbi:MAG: hemerythrin domain-containing protein [Sulfobacillus sp.]